MSWLKMKEIKREKCPSEFRTSLFPLFLSLSFYVHYIRHIIYSSVCRRSHGVRGATNRILRRWRRSKTKLNKARREEERTKGSLSFTEIARPHRGAYEDERIACARSISLPPSLRVCVQPPTCALWAREIEYLSRQKHFPGSFLPPGDPWPPEALPTRAHAPAATFLLSSLGFSASRRTGGFRRP